MLSHPDCKRLLNHLAGVCQEMRVSRIPAHVRHMPDMIGTHRSIRHRKKVSHTVTHFLAMISGYFHKSGVPGISDSGY